MLPVLAALQLLVAAPPVTRTPALHVPSQADGALPCPANAALRSAIALRLPSVRLGAGRTEPDDLIASLGKVGTVWWFEVKRASGGVAMSRALMTDSDCPQLADTAALILERYLADIEWRGRPMGIALAPIAKPPPSIEATDPQAGLPERSRGGSVPLRIRNADSARDRVGQSGDAAKPEIAPTPDIPTPREAVTLGPSGRSGTQLVPGESGFATNDVAINSRTSVTTPAIPTPPKPKPGPEPIASKPKPAPEPIALKPKPEPEPIASRPVAAIQPPPDEVHLPAEPPAPGAPILSRWAVSLGGGGWYSIPTDLTGAFSLEVAVMMLERVRLSAWFAGGTFMSRDLQSRGSLRAEAFVGLITASLCTGERFSGCGGLAAGAQLTTGAIATTPTTGQRIYRPSDEVITLPVLGLFGRLALAIFGPLELAVDLSALVPLGSGSFAIEGFTTPAYTTPPAELIAALRLGWKFY